MSGVQTTIGLEVCLAEPPSILRRARFGLLMNQASVDRRFRYAHHLLAERFGTRLGALFSPQHGLWGAEQDNMIESPHGFDAELRIPIHSLYSEHRRPTAEMLAGLDCLVVDLQDVGTRVYTFIWTLSYCLEACAAAGTAVVVLDRPNPLGGVDVEGPLLDPAFASFVGRAALPMRHGLTIGEMARLLNDQMNLGAELDVVPMRDWRRAMRLAETGRVWVPPSPNLPRVEGVDVYPGQVLLEGTTLSEGRGTTTPFELFGAPYIDPVRLLAELKSFELPGVVFRPIAFEPTFQKYARSPCRGLYLHVVDPVAFRPYRTTVACLASIHRLWPEEFGWRQPPYEYETEKPPIDILSGGRALREAVDGEVPWDDERLATLSDADHDGWWELAADYLVYP